MTKSENVNISASLEDYLEAILVLYQQKDTVRMTDIANFLNVSKPSVNKAIGALKNSGLLNHETYGKIELTNAGRNHAKAVLRRHNLLRDFLNIALGVNINIAEKDACKIEHVISNESVEKLSQFFESLNENSN